MGVVPLRMVKVSVPSLTVPDGLVTVALSVTVWAAELNVVLTVAAIVCTGLAVSNGGYVTVGRVASLAWSRILAAIWVGSVVPQ